MFDEQPNYLLMASERGLVQWGGMGVVIWRIETIGIFAGIEQKTDDFDMARVCGKRKGAVSVVFDRGR